MENKISWIWLVMAIITETTATSALKATDGFKNAVPAIITVAGYASSFFFLALVLRTMPLATAYAIWSGAGVVVIALVGRLYYKQALDTPAIAGIILIVTGTLAIRLFSKNVRL